MKGLRTIWQGASKFHVALFIVLCAVSLLLLTSVPVGYKLCVVSFVLGGILYFLILAFMAMIPPLWKMFRFILRSTIVELTVFVSVSILATSLLIPSFIIVAAGALAWLVNLSIVSCMLPYSVSTKLSTHSPRALGWIFLIFTAVVNFMLCRTISPMHQFEPLLYVYVFGWLAPCIAIAFVKYHDQRMFATYSLVALVYSVYPVSYRLYSLLGQLTGSPGELGYILSGLPIEEAITVFMFAWALNSVGHLASNEYRLFKEGKEKIRDTVTGPLRRLKHENDTEFEAIANAASLFDEFKTEELAVNPVLVFGLLFSALAYFAFRHGSGSFGIPQYIEPGVALILSMVVAVPLLFYITIKRRNCSNTAAHSQTKSDL